METADARQPDRLFTGGFAHPRQAMRIAFHAPRPACPSDHRCSLPLERSAPLHRTATGRDASLMPIRTPPHTGILTIGMAVQRCSGPVSSDRR